jgi:flagellar protein FlgJ
VDYSIRNNAAETMLRLPAGGSRFMELKTSGSLESTGAGRVRDIETRKAELRDTAEKFEAIFIRQFMKTLRSTLPGEGLFGGGASGEIYADMMDNAVSDAVSKRGAFGIADMVYQRLVSRLDTSGGETSQET